MRDKAILENGGTLKPVSDYYKSHKMQYKAVDNYLHALYFVPDYYKTQKMWDKVVDTHPATTKYVPNGYKTQEKCNKAVHRCFFICHSIPDQ